MTGKFNQNTGQENEMEFFPKRPNLSQMAIWLPKETSTMSNLVQCPEEREINHIDDPISEIISGQPYESNYSENQE